MEERNCNYYSILTYDVLYSNKISSSEKLLYATITSLSQKDGCCYASNKYLSELYNTTEITISRQINKLFKEGFVEIETAKKGGVVIQRKILPLTKMLVTVNKNVNGTVNKNVKDNNISNINNINNIFKKPTLEEVKQYCIERNNNVDAKKFYDYYEIGDWKDAKGNKIKNWKQKLITWETHTKENKQNTPEWLNKEVKENTASKEEIEELERYMRI